MKDIPGTNSALIEEREISALKKRIKELERFKSKHIQAEKKLRESEKRYQNIVESSVEGIFRATGQGRFSNANRAAAHMLGYESPEELINSMADIASQLYVNPEDRDKTLGLLLKHGSVKNFEVKCRHKNGNIIWGVLNMHLVKDGQGNVLYIEGTCQDITHRKQAEEKLRESEEKYRQLVDSINKGICVAQDGALKFVNPMLMKIFGYSKHDLTTSPFTKFIYPDDRNMVLERHIRRMKGEKFSTRYEFRILTNDGSMKWVELDSVMIQWEGKPAALAFIGDITKRKQIETALRENEKKYRLLVDNSHDIIYSLTAEGVFIFVSHAWTTILGHRSAEVVGKSFQLFVHHDDMPGCMAFLKSVIETGQRQSGVEYRVQHKNGTWRWHTSSAVPFKDENGTVIGFYGIAKDITENKQIREEREELILELQEALHKVKTLSGLLPICASCKKILNDKGQWEQMEVYIRDRSEAEFSHGICPECTQKLYPEYFKKK